MNDERLDELAAIMRSRAWKPLVIDDDETPLPPCWVGKDGEIVFGGVRVSSIQAGSRLYAQFKRAFPHEKREPTSLAKDWRP